MAHLKKIESPGNQQLQKASAITTTAATIKTTAATTTASTISLAASIKTAATISTEGSNNNNSRQQQ